ncbi:MAG: HAD family hydrolase [Halobellus sp.]|uniref:HAD family hydrolase n=1 Tax=Halobellus sp. TaxID=1979212 RepID=UPI0035D3E4C0
MAYDAVLFDNDGVLVKRSPLELLSEAAADAFAALGVEDPADEAIETVSYVVTPDRLAGVCSTYGVDSHEFWTARDRVASDAQVASMRRGGKPWYDDVDALESLSGPLGIVSTNQQATIDAILRHYDLEPLFETAYGREPTVESLRRKKPAPHYLERALSDLGADSALFVGDSEPDLLAASRAGVDSALVRRPHVTSATLDATPTYELDSLWDLHELPGVTLSEN